MKSLGTGIRGGGWCGVREKPREGWTMPRACGMKWPIPDSNWNLPLHKNAANALVKGDARTVKLMGLSQELYAAPGLH